MEKDDEILGQNLVLLRANVLYEYEKFKRLRGNNYVTKAEMHKAVRNHLNRLFKNDVARLQVLQVGYWGLKTKDI